jgi:prepilin-type N-terminal cleavage/methylation domain-containing protein
MKKLIKSARTSSSNRKGTTLIRTSLRENLVNVKGFTLIELLIVIAILGVLAVVVLVAINPVQQLARTRDAGRKSSIGQVGRALQAYYTARNGAFVPETAPDTDWMGRLVTSGELSTQPSAIAYSAITDPGCAGTHTADNGLCYDNNTTDIIIYAGLESNVEDSKCATATDRPFFVYSSADGRAGLVCLGAAAFPSSGAQTWNATQ